MDFESLLVPTSDGRIEHIPSGVCALRASKYPKHNGEPHVYSDPITTPGHVVKNMFDYLEELEEYIDSALNPNKPMKLTKDDWRDYNKATHCYGCNRSFEFLTKNRDHDHVTGKYKGTACSRCNLSFKPQIHSKGCVLHPSHFAQRLQL